LTWGHGTPLVGAWVPGVRGCLCCFCVRCSVKSALQSPQTLSKLCLRVLESFKPCQHFPKLT
jgi:hypothetical protein